MCAGCNLKVLVGRVFLGGSWTLRMGWEKREVQRWQNVFGRELGGRIHSISLVHGRRHPSVCTKMLGKTVEVELERYGASCIGKGVRVE